MSTATPMSSSISYLLRVGMTQTWLNLISSKLRAVQEKRERARGSRRRAERGMKGTVLSWETCVLGSSAMQPGGRSFPSLD